MNKRYVYTGERRRFEARGREVAVKRIKAAEDFDVYALKRQYTYDNEKECVYVKDVIYVKHIKAGQLGGWIEFDDNLQEEGWIEEGMVFGGAVVKGTAWVGGEKTIICDSVQVCDESKVVIFKEDFDKYGNYITVSGDIKICGRSKIIAPVCGHGVVKDLLINSPQVIKPRISPNTAGTPVKLECTIGDRKVASRFVL